MKNCTLLYKQRNFSRTQQLRWGENRAKWSDEDATSRAHVLQEVSARQKRATLCDERRAS